MPFCPKCGKEVSPEASCCTSCGASLKVEKVRYDGLYVSGPHEIDSYFTFDGPQTSYLIFRYLRFYEDGTVLAASCSDSVNSPNQVIRWFDKNHPNISKGQYSIQGNTIQFSATSPQGVTVDYVGRIIGDCLELQGDDYRFVEVS